MTANTYNEEENLKLWVTQLYREFEEINWYYYAKLKPVVIQVVDLNNQWGQWDPFFRVITINQKLIKTYSWDVVLEVLKHEMAHQYVHEVLGFKDEVHHGEAFKIACEKLGVSSWAAKATGELPREIPTLRERVLSTDDERLLDRVEKLLALAQSANEHEAVLAMEKVRELYAKHNIERLRSSCSGAMDSLIICRKRQKLEPHETMIFSVLNEHFFVKVVHTSLYNAVDRLKYKAAELLGLRENLLMAEYVFYFLLRKCESLWTEHRKKTSCEGRLRRSYLLGVIHGFSEKLALQDVQKKVSTDLGLSSTESRSLILIGKKEMDEFMDLRFPRTRSKSRSGARVNGGVFEQGKAAGKTINIHKGLTNRGGFGGYLR